MRKRSWINDTNENQSLFYNEIKTVKNGERLHENQNNFSKKLAFPFDER